MSTHRWIDPERAARILDATYLQVHPTCPDCGHQFTDASRQEIEDHITAAHVEQLTDEQIAQRFEAHREADPHCTCNDCIAWTAREGEIERFDPPADPPLHCARCGVVYPADQEHTCRRLTRTERLQAAADAGFDTWEDYRGEK